MYFLLHDHGHLMNLFLIIVAILTFTLLFIFAALYLWRRSRRHRIFADNRIAAPQGIEALEKVSIGGIDQWLHFRGQDIANPVLLFLHGGPGAAGIAFGRQMQNAWEKNFTVVQWDQRGGGKTFTSNLPSVVAPTMTIEQYITDTKDVIDYLCSRLNKRKIVLLGHSWGTYLGIVSAARYPEQIAAYVGSGQIVHPVEYEALAYDLVLNIARRRNDQAAIRQLTGISRPPSSPDQFINSNKIINLLFIKYMNNIYGAEAKHPSILGAYLDALCSPEYTLRDMMSIHKGAFYCRDAMFGPNSVPGKSAVRHVDVRSEGLDFKVPIFFLLGRHDYATPSIAATQYFDSIRAPVKKLIWFENSGHSPMIEEPDAYEQALTEHVLPVCKFN